MSCCSVVAHRANTSTTEVTKAVDDDGSVGAKMSATVPAKRSCLSDDMAVTPAGKVPPLLATVVTGAAVSFWTRPPTMHQVCFCRAIPGVVIAM